jgi:tetratricopeptide (TPR) repeat protein
MPETSKPACTERRLYLQQLPDGSFEEARAVVLGRFVENELGEPLLEKVKQHLQRCGCCTQFVGELTKFETVSSVSIAVPYAVCPSSEALDRYVFSSERVEDGERALIKQHLVECPLCREEAEWVRRLEQPQPAAPAPSFVRWAQIGWVAAGFALFVLSAVLIWQNQAGGLPAEQLRALAVIQEPEQMNYDNLDATAAALSPETEQMYRQAVASFRKRDFAHAASQFEEVLALSPHHSAALYLLGYTYYWLDEPEKAFALCERAETVRPHAYERCMSLVNIALKTGHFGRAVEEITTLYHDAPDHPEIHRMYFSIMKLTEGRKLTL